MKKERKSLELVPKPKISPVVSKPDEMQGRPPERDAGVHGGTSRSREGGQRSRSPVSKRLLKGKRVVAGVCGGIAAYKTCELIRLLVLAGADVHVVMTDAGREFVTPLTFQTLTGNPCHYDLFNLIEEGEIGHISLADMADAVIIAPATANTIAKLAHGLCDNLLSTVVLATRAPVVIAPSMNSNMWEHGTTQENVNKLKSLGYQIIDPDSGSLACGTGGKGRLPDPAILFETIKSILKR